VQPLKYFHTAQKKTPTIGIHPAKVSKISVKTNPTKKMLGKTQGKHANLLAKI
jgi:hypothetical protein